MRATRFNHVSIPCRDLDESERFYRDVFGVERIPAYDFQFPVRYYRVGEQQLHLMQLPQEQPLPNQHLAFDVDDFEATFVKVRELGALDTGTHEQAVWELPDGAVQMYVRDPAGNLVEVNWPDVSTLDRDVVGEIPRRADQIEQSDEALRATLYHTHPKKLPAEGRR